MPEDIKGVKVNGTSHKIDFNTLANKPFGNEERVTLYAFHEGPLTTASNPETLHSEEYAVIGDMYIVTWDSVEYPCIAVYEEGLDGPPSVSLRRLVNTADTEIYEPFMICYTNDAEFNIRAGDDESGHTVTIDHVVRSKTADDNLDILDNYLVGNYDYMVFSHRVHTVVNSTMTMYPCTLDKGTTPYVYGSVGILPTTYDLTKGYFNHALLIDNCPYRAGTANPTNFRTTREPNHLYLKDTYGSDSFIGVMLGSAIKESASHHDVSEDFLSTIDDNTYYIMFMTNSTKPQHTIKLDCVLETHY